MRTVEHLKQPDRAGHSLAFRRAMGEELDVPRATPADAFTAAREHFRAGRKLDMGALAGELGVARATLYRWTGDRDQLLADVIYAEMHDMIAAAAAHAGGRGLKRLERAVAWFLAALTGGPALQALLANEGDRGLRMILAPAGPIRPRIVAMVAEIIGEEADAGRYAAPAPPALLADGVVAIVERYLHNAGDPSLNPDPATANAIVSLILRERVGERAGGRAVAAQRRRA